MNKIIAVDCDLTVVDTGLAWLKWLNSVSRSLKYTHEELLGNGREISYNLGEYFPTLQHHVEPMDFWRNKYLYYGMTPIKGSVDALLGLANQGYKIVFVSSITGQHASSKYYWLKEHFPFLDGVVFTREKDNVRCDVLIDDRNDFLNLMPCNVMKIRYNTPYTQTKKQHKDTIVLNEWSQIANKIRSEIK